ncbi:MAG: RteC domain-containing protein [Flavobacteriaceae bacterium]|nr:RteC domain-containing protein [Flavobacteriaceae bacterium]
MRFEILLQKLNDQLNEIKEQYPEIIKQSSQSILLCRDILAQMNKIVISKSFGSESDEIHFFKNIKVVPLTELIYFSEIRSLEIQFPKANIQEQKDYVKYKIRKANKFFHYNLEFIQYVREERTELDKIYYTRVNGDSLNITNMKAYFRSPEFSTSHDILLGKVYAYERFSNYLKNRLFQLKNPHAIGILDIHKKSPLHWTCSKIALTELIYALHSSGAINSGAADISQLASIAEELFNVELGDYYRTYLSLRNRKINRTKFLDKLKDSLLDHMDDLDA